MHTPPSDLARIEERCRGIDARLGDERAGLYCLIDAETSLTLVYDLLDRRVDGYVRIHGGSETAFAARAAHNDLRRRLDAIARYRDVLPLAELRSSLQAAHACAWITLRILQRNIAEGPAPLFLYRRESA